MEISNQVPSGGKVRLYAPGGYAVTGFFLGLLPVFLMSFPNSKVLPNGAALRSKLKVFLVIWVALLGFSIGLLVWATHTMQSAIVNFAASNPMQAYQIGGDRAALASAVPQLDFAAKVVQNSGIILWILQICLLIFAVRTLNKLELPAFNALKAEGKVEVRSSVMPIVIGIAFLILINAFFTYLPQVLLIA